MFNGNDLNITKWIDAILEEYILTHDNFIDIFVKEFNSIEVFVREIHFKYIVTKREKCWQSILLCVWIGFVISGAKVFFRIIQGWNAIERKKKFLNNNKTIKFGKS